MNVECIKHPSATVIKVVGRIDAASSAQFERSGLAELDAGAVNLILDLSELEYISSMGLRALLNIAKRVQEKNGAVRLCGVKGMVKEVLKITNLLAMFPLFDTSAAALVGL